MAGRNRVAGGATRAPSSQRRAVPAPVSIKSDTGSVSRLSTTRVGVAAVVRVRWVYPPNTRHVSCAGSRRSQVDCRCSAVSVAAGVVTRCPQPKARTSSRGVAANTRCASPDATRSRVALAPGAATCDSPRHDPAAASPSRLVSGPLIRTLPSCHWRTRSTAGTGLVPSDTRAGPEISPSTARNHFAPGRGGSIVIDTAGALSSTPIAPVDVVMRSQKGSAGSTSGVPPARGSVTVMSPIRNCVWVHELRKPPTFGAVAALRPPAANRLPIVSGCRVSSTLNGLLAIGRSRSRPASSVDPSSGCAGRDAVWPAAEAGPAIIATASSAAFRSR